MLNKQKKIKNLIYVKLKLLKNQIFNFKIVIKETKRNFQQMFRVHFFFYFSLITLKY